jgi:hypothetical protein
VDGVIVMGRQFVKLSKELSIRTWLIWEL